MHPRQTFKPKFKVPGALGSRCLLSRLALRSPVIKDSRFLSTGFLGLGYLVGTEQSWNTRQLPTAELRPPQVRALFRKLERREVGGHCLSEVKVWLCPPHTPTPPC